MPQRPRSHVLGDRALREFSNTIGDDWVIRVIGSNDYGVDAEVEIFEDGHATGASFKVQIKGSDTAPKNGRHSVSVGKSTLNYWLKLDVPVLVYYYAALTDRSYARWAHSYKPPFRKGAPSGSARPRSSISFSFSGVDSFSNLSLDRIRDDVQAFRALRARVNLSRLPMRIETKGRIGVSTDELLARMHSAFNAGSDIFTIAEDDTLGSTGLIRFEARKFCVEMPAKLASLTVHHELLDWSHPDLVRRLIADTQIAAANLLASMGMSSQAVRLCREFEPDSDIVAAVELSEALVVAFLSEGDADGALKLLAPVFVSDDPQVRAYADLAFSLHSALASAALSEEGTELFLWLLDQRAVIELSANRPTEAARGLYAKAQVCRVNKRWLDALTNFDQLPTLDETYLTRGYYHRERGGCLADLERWHEAVDAYEAAQSCSDRVIDIDFVLADARLQSGQYGSARNGLTEASQDEPYFQRRSKVVLICAEWATDAVGRDTQYRSQFTEAALHQQPEQLAADDVLELLRQSDALDFNLCGKFVESLGGEVEDRKALGAVTTMARTTLDDPRPWITAIMLAIATGESTDQIEALAEQLIYFCRDTFPPVLDQLAGVVDSGTFTQGRALIYQMARRQSYRHPLVYRFHEPDGTFRVLELQT